jgi:hypothetical protein
MSETIRIRTTPNGSDKYLKVKIDQEFDFIEVLSMKITQEDAYRNFCSDYGVIVGRVIINSGFGLPNARVSVFLPIDDEDKNDTVINGLYPYSIVTDKDSDGIRYNLLPKNSETNNDCFTPIGTFPNKREILDNEELLHVYCKYYKYTTTTNAAGDFMIFGVPIGTHTIHVDADISDIGIVSQRPYDLISQGTPIKFFESPTKFKGGANLDKLVQVKSTNYSVNVQPFWGEAETCEIGISRADIDMNYNVIPSAMFVGSIFGDQDKNSVNKRCRPRRELGELCSQVASEGTIEMLRETIDGGVEQFDIDGGRLIDEDGAWAYQIPMNLDYVVTDENGDLIPSDDPNKGIATRASVRFKIGMDNTGGEGRLRTRAKYLVPNNPRNSTEIDYKFDETTKKTSFRSLNWNKIYTISNFIPRFQTRAFPPKTRAFTGVKDVDDCAGDKNPFPYNRVNTSFSAIFFIICLIIKIVGFLIWIMNFIIIPIINIIVFMVNIIIGILRRLFSALCQLANVEIPVINVRPFKWILGWTCSVADALQDIPYVKCLTVECPSDTKIYYAPGCLKSSNGFKALEPYDVPKYFPGDNWGHGFGFGDLAGLDNCVAFEMAKSMGLFQFDFYNDWVNGTLFGFLLKYKKKRRGREKFCEYDCSPQYFSQGGVDGNKNNNGDNDCRTNYLFDSCYPTGNHIYGAISIYNNSQNSTENVSLREGLVKKIDVFKDGKKISEEFYYAATKHDVSFKLFATDIVCLGSVFDCDWQGIPKIQSLLIPTTYKLPPDTQELTDDDKTETTGQVGLGGNIKGLFFEVSCLGIHSDSRQVLNIRHICEMGVDLDEINFDPNGTLIYPNGNIGKIDIDEDGGKWFRDVFYDLNKNLPNSVTSFNHGASFTTEFNINNQNIYDFVSSNDNGQDYVNFRGYQPDSDSSFAQPKNSFYFYFGILPGKGGLDKLNQRFFTKCIPVAEKEFNIVSSSIPTSNTNPNGSITFTVVSGTAPFTYTISGPNGVTNGTFQIDPATGEPIPLVITGPQGSYDIEVIDANGNVVTQTVSIDGPEPFYGSASVKKMCTSATLADGEISIDSIGGGTGIWTYTLYRSNGAIVSNGSIVSSPFIINGLSVDKDSDGTPPPDEHFGYILVLSDGVTNITVYNLLIDGPTPVVLTMNNIVKTTCWESRDGEFEIGLTGGASPYTLNVTGPVGYADTVFNANTLFRGNYSATVVDSYGSTTVLNFTVDSKNPKMVAGIASATDLARQCNPNALILPFYILEGAPIPVGATPPIPNIKVSCNFNNLEDSNGPIWVDYLSTTPFVNDSTYVYLTLPPILTNGEEIKFKFKSVDELCFSNEIIINESEIRLPPAFLGVNFNGINNAMQCNPNVLTFKFNVTHWEVAGPSYSERKPYEFKYKINGYGPTGTNSFFIETIVNNQQLINENIPAAVLAAIPFGATTYPVTITYTITDNKGCTASGTLPTITMPVQSLVGSVSRTNTTVGTLTTCYYKFTASGGIGPYNGSPSALNVNYASGTGNNISNPSAFCSVYPNPAVNTTITDSVGCTIIKST